MNARLLLIAMLGLMSAGCATVHMAEPLGGPLDKPLDPAAWNGTWLAREGLGRDRSPILVRVADPTSGTLRIAWIEDEKDGFKLRTASLVVRRLEPTLALCMKDTNPEYKERNEAPWLLLGRLKIAPGRGLLWAPETHAFSAMVKAGKLPGTSKDENTVILRRLKPDQQDAITSSSATFAWDAPTVLEKID